MESDRHTCLKLELPSGHGPIFVKGTWFNSHFHLSITDGLHAWTCHATEAEVRLRAEQWDQPVSDYLALVERYLGVQQTGSCYAFEDAGNGSRRLSWTFEKQGTKLEWRWKCQPSSDDKQTTAQILDFLMDANVRLSDEVVRNSQAFAKLKSEAERCLSLSGKYNKEKDTYETAVYGKETYTSSMSQKYGYDESNHPEFDPEVWCDAIGGRGTTRTHFYGFGITPRGKNFASTTINAEDASYSACSRPNVEHEQTPVEVDNLREEVSLVKDRIINLEDKVEKQASDTADIKKYLEQMMEMFNHARMFTNASMGPSQPPT